MLHPDDLAADKVLALWGRARPRDFYDVAALLDRYGPDRLLDLAATKDNGFTAGTFVDALRAIQRLGAADWAEDGITTDDATRLHALFDDWRTRLTSPDNP
ncbi:MAG TPA: nucleotidyl transferase AbiEii/AbiGii toxin family protein [Pseudonocardiaceae bacterium]|nr:nucleotidyl transferase AbiEii/AbiGii toxin family protein [Pseudonocardiaceae bacterium]